MTYSVTPSASGTSIKQDGVEVANINASGEWSFKVGASLKSLAQVVADTSPTLLGTLNTTSGVTQELTGLDLTGYTAIEVYVDRVSHNNAAGGSIRLAGVIISSSIASADFLYGYARARLDFSGVGFGAIGGSATNGVTNGNTGTNTQGFELGISQATTSLVFSWSNGGAFDNGTIRVYGVK